MLGWPCACLVRVGTTAALPGLRAASGARERVSTRPAKAAPAQDLALLPFGSNKQPRPNPPVRIGCLGRWPFLPLVYGVYTRRSHTKKASQHTQHANTSNSPRQLMESQLINS
jgi:hypothetical protein